MGQYFLNLCNIRPSDNPAVIFQHESTKHGPTKSLLTYKELTDVADQLGCGVQKDISNDGGVQKQYIGIYSDMHLHLPVIVFTLLKSNTAFVPLMVKSASDVFIHCLRKCGIKFVFVQKVLLSSFTSLLRNDVVIVANHQLDVLTDYLLVELSIGQQCFPHEIAYVVQSSGTTGQPKLIFVPQDCVTTNVLDFRNIFNVNHEDLIFISSSLTFDASLVQMFLTWSSGASMLLVSSTILSSPSLLSDALYKNKVTILQCTPSLMLLIGQKLLKQSIFCQETSLRVLALGGERLPNKHELFDLVGHVKSLKIYNVYGTSELSAWASIYQIQKKDMRKKLISSQHTGDWVPVGKSLTNTKVEIRDKTVDGYGEIWIGSTERRCYINEEIFSDAPEERPTGDLGIEIDEQIYYCCRKNNLVKRNGQFVNLDSLSQIIESIKNIRSCHCLMANNERLNINKQLLCFVCSSTCGGEQIIEREILKIVGNTFSRAYLPDRIVFVDSIPITSHGKIDQKALASKVSHASYDFDSLTTCLQYYWCTALKLNTPPAFDDNFVACGGDSFSAAFLINGVSSHIDGSVPYEELFNLVMDGTFNDVCSFLTNLRSRDETGQYVHTKPRTNNESDQLSHKHFEISSKQNFKYRCVCNRNESKRNESKRIPSLSTPTQRCPLTLTQLWKYDLKKCIDASPLVVSSDDHFDGVVYIGSHSHVFSAILLCTGETLWETVLGGRVESSAMLTADGNLVCVGCYDGILYFLQKLTGQIYWQYKVNDVIKSSPSMDFQNGIVVVGSHDKCVHALSVQSKSCLWRMDFGSSCFSTPFIDAERNVAYICLLSGTAVCLHLKTGHVIWRTSVGKPIFSSPCMVSDRLIFGCVDGFLYAVACVTGKILWKMQTSAPIFSSPVSCHEEFILFGSNDTYCYCVNVEGELIWKYKSSSPVYSGCCILETIRLNRKNVGVKRRHDTNIKCGEKFHFNRNHGDIVAVLATDGSMSLLDARTGASLLTHKLPGDVFSTPVVFNDKLVVGCRDNYVYCFTIG